MKNPLKLSLFCFAPLLSLLFLAVTIGCGGHSPTPAQVANAIITCTETICTTSPSTRA